MHLESENPIYITVHKIVAQKYGQVRAKKEEDFVGESDSKQLTTSNRKLGTELVHLDFVG